MISASNEPQVVKRINDLPGNDSTNLQDFLAENSDFSIIENGGLKILTYKLCSAYLSNPSCNWKKNEAENLKKDLSCKGPHLEEEEYTSYVSGKKMQNGIASRRPDFSGKTSKTQSRCGAASPVAETTKKEIVMVNNQLHPCINSC